MPRFIILAFLAIILNQCICWSTILLSTNCIHHQILVALWANHASFAMTTLFAANATHCCYKRIVIGIPCFAASTSRPFPFTTKLHLETIHGTSIWSIQNGLLRLMLFDKLLTALNIQMAFRTVHVLLTLFGNYADVLQTLNFYIWHRNDSIPMRWLKSRTSWLAMIHRSINFLCLHTRRLFAPWNWRLTSGLPKLTMIFIDLSLRPLCLVTLI